MNDAKWKKSRRRRSRKYAETLLYLHVQWIGASHPDADTLIPPSIGMPMPVIYDAWSDKSSKSVAVKTSTFPTRPRGGDFSKNRSSSGRSRAMERFISVAMYLRNPVNTYFFGGSRIKTGGMDGPGRDCVDSDPMRSNFHGQVPGECEYCTLARRVR
jgi:hypothetical protein